MPALIKSLRLQEELVDLYPVVSSGATFPDRSEKVGDVGAKVFPDAMATCVETMADKSATLPINEAVSEQILFEARLQEWLKEHQHLLQEAEERAKADGFAKGMAEGLEAGEGKYAVEIQSLSSLVQSAKESLETMLRGLDGVIASIVFEAVCKIVGRELATADGCVAVVRQLISQECANNPLRIRISPADLQRLRESASHRPEAGWVENFLNLPLEADERVELGGCLLDIQDGSSIDGRIETQFRSFAQSLKNAVKSS